MAIAYKKIVRKNPWKQGSPELFHSLLMAQGKGADLNDIAYLMKEASSLSLGDIKSVLTNFAECMRILLFTGQPVKIGDFGTFRLNARTIGSPTEKECGVKNIKSVKINFLAAASVKPNLAATRAGDRVCSFSLATKLKKKNSKRKIRGFESVYCVIITYHPT